VGERLPSGDYAGVAGLSPAGSAAAVD
jgi:hypothetical protein